MSTPRPTSVEQYHKLTSKFLNEWHNMIMDTMFTRPGKIDWTAREVRQAIIDGGIMSADLCLSSTISARIHELKFKWGLLIQQDGRRICEVSGNWATAVYPNMVDYRDYQDEQMREEIEEEPKKEDPFKDLLI